MYLMALETLGLTGGALCWRQASCPGKDLAGAAEATPARVLPGESTSPSCSLCVSGLGIALVVLCSGFPALPRYVRPRHAALTTHAKVKGSKGEPLLLYTDNMLEYLSYHVKTRLLL